MTCEIEVINEKTGSKRRHITTIAGPQAAAILSVNDGNHCISWRDKSVEGLAVAELWTEVTYYEKEAGTYD